MSEINQNVMKEGRSLAKHKVLFDQLFRKGDHIDFQGYYPLMSTQADCRREKTAPILYDRETNYIKKFQKHLDKVVNNRIESEEYNYSHYFCINRLLFSYCIGWDPTFKIPRLFCWVDDIRDNDFPMLSAVDGSAFLSVLKRELNYKE